MKTRISRSSPRLVPLARVAVLGLLLAAAIWPLVAGAQTAGTGLPSTLPPLMPGYTGSQIVMTRTVWQQFVGYLNNQATGFGFFLISVDGQRGVEKSCGDYTCQISLIEQQFALDDCQATNKNRARCIVFAEGRNIKMGYQVLP